MTNPEKIAIMAKFCYEISQTEHDVFFSYHPNINSVSIVVYKGGWKQAILGPICSLPILEEYWKIDDLSVSRTKKVIVDLLDIEILPPPCDKKCSRLLTSIKEWLLK